MVFYFIALLFIGLLYDKNMKLEGYEIVLDVLQEVARRLDDWADKELPSMTVEQQEAVRKALSATMGILKDEGLKAMKYR